MSLGTRATHIPVQRASCQFCLILISHEQLGASAQPHQPATDTVSIHTSGCCCLFEVGPNTPYLAHLSPGFCACRPLLWPVVAQSASYLALMQTRRYCTLFQHDLPPDLTLLNADRCCCLVQSKVYHRSWFSCLPMVGTTR